VTGLIADSWGPEWSLAYGSLESLAAVAVAVAFTWNSLTRPIINSSDRGRTMTVP